MSITTIKLRLSILLLALLSPMLAHAASCGPYNVGETRCSAGGLVTECREDRYSHKFFYVPIQDSSGHMVKCGGENPIASTRKIFFLNTPNALIAAPACHGPGFSCSNSTECCGSSYCEDGYCSVDRSNNGDDGPIGQCFGEGATCNSINDCCGSLTCTGSGTCG